jgi:hypothetical protein
MLKQMNKENHSEMCREAQAQDHIQGDMQKGTESVGEKRS